MQNPVPSSLVRRAVPILLAAAMTLTAATTALAGAQVRPPIRDGQRDALRDGSDGERLDRQREDRADGYAYTGPYVQGALSIGRIDFDGSVDRDASGGFMFGGGYRALPWLAAEAHFQFLGGQENVDIGPIDRDSEFFSFTVGPKLYPLGLFEIEEIPDTIQPYAAMGFGGGRSAIEGNRDKSSFSARFILGLDFWLDDHLGLFVEGGGYAIGDGFVNGTGVFNVGASWRF